MKIHKNTKSFDNIKNILNIARGIKNLKKTNLPVLLWFHKIALFLTRDKSIHKQQNFGIS